VALGAAGVGEAFTLHGDKLPLVALRVQGELEDAVDVVDAHLAVGDRVRDRRLASARSSLSHLVWLEPGPQRTSWQLLFRATTCQEPRL
jgi:hypothetical protein